MIDLQAAVREMIPRLRRAGTDLRSVEAKAAVGVCPRRSSRRSRRSRTPTAG